MPQSEAVTKAVSIEDHRQGVPAKTGTYLERLSELSIGLTSFGLFGFSFSYILYPFIIYRLGIVTGGVVMTFLSFVVCLTLLKLYDSSKKDWLGIEAIKGLKTYNGSKMLGRFTSWLMKKGTPVVFVFLSIRFDPFITTAYFRQGKFNGLSKRDWSIFMGSLFLSNAHWIFICYAGISLFEWAWRVVAG